jgi:hypothetical protein
MRYKLFVILLIAITAPAAMPQSFKQLHQIKALAESFTVIGLMSNLSTAYAMADMPDECLVDKFSSDANSPNVAGPNVTGLKVVTARPVKPSDEFRWRGRLAAGRSIEVKGINGEVRAEGSTGNEVEVVASKRGRKSNPAEVEIRVVEHAGGVTICAVYPSGDSSQPNDCQPGKAGHSNVRNNDVQVDFTVRVPEGVNFSGRTVNGGVVAESIGGDVEAYTVNGSINISAAGTAAASTVNGSIKAAMGRANWTKELEFETVNGSITLNLPAGLSTQFRAETLNGDISTDFQLTMQERLSRRRMSGTIGSGGRELTLKTVNGDIRLQRGGI